MNATRKVKLKDITDNLTCNLCKGYFIDATTIVECLHSFCKSCIVKHLEKSEYCPVCDVQLHSTKPLNSIKSDQMLQEIVYKLVPGLFRKEMEQRRQFYESHQDSIPMCQMDSGRVFNELYITSDDVIHISLEYFTSDESLKENTKRFLKCPAAVSVSILKKLLQGKFDLSQKDAQVDIMYGERILPDDFLLMDIAYKYSWTNNGTKPLQLSYRVQTASSEKLSLSNAATSRANRLLKRRQSRANTIDCTPTIPEVLKNANRNSVHENFGQSPISSPKLTANGKVRGRKKRSATIDGMSVTPTMPKPTQNSKLEKLSPEKNFRETECQSESTSLNGRTPPKKIEKEKEVQLRISETGIIRARNVSSGEEKVIVNMAQPSESGHKIPDVLAAKGSNTPPNGIFNGSVCSTSILGKSETPNGVTIQPLLLSEGGDRNLNYVRLNIPIVTLGSAPSNNNIANKPTPSINGGLSKSPTPNGPHPPLANGHLHSSSNSNAKSANPSTQKPTQSKKRQNDKSQLKSPKRSIMSKSNNPLEFEDKKANVQKALIDLEKKLSTSGFPQGLNGNVKKMGVLGLSPDTHKIEQNSVTNMTNGSHKSLPATSTSNNSVPLSIQPYLNGMAGTSSLPFPLTFGSSGMTVNLITSTANAHNGNILPSGSKSMSPSQRRYTNNGTHHSNGDARFMTPRPILPSPSKDQKPITASNVTTPPNKKPPKFFKSRHSQGSSSDSESPNKKAAQQEKCGATKSDGVSKTIQLAHGSTPIMSKPSSLSSVNGSNTTTTPSGIANPATSNIHRQLSAPTLFNPNLHPYINQLQMSLAAAAAASTNNMLVPFVTSNYCSMPFLNNVRSPFMNNLPFTLPFSGMTNPNFSANTTTSYSSPSVQRSMAPEPNKSGSVNGCSSNSGEKEYLDLSINKEKKKRSREATPCQEEPLSLKKPKLSSPLPELIKPVETAGCPNGTLLTNSKNKSPSLSSDEAVSPLSHSSSDGEKNLAANEAPNTTFAGTSSHETLKVLNTEEKEESKNEQKHSITDNKSPTVCTSVAEVCCESPRTNISEDNLNDDDEKSLVIDESPSENIEVDCVTERGESVSEKLSTTSPEPVTTPIEPSNEKSTENATKPESIAPVDPEAPSCAKPEETVNKTPETNNVKAVDVKATQNTTVSLEDKEKSQNVPLCNNNNNNNDSTEEKNIPSNSSTTGA